MGTQYIDRLRVPELFANPNAAEMLNQQQLGKTL